MIIEFVNGKKVDAGLVIDAAFECPQFVEMLLPHMVEGDSKEYIKKVVCVAKLFVKNTRKSSTQPAVKQSGMLTEMFSDFTFGLFDN